jgi:hypothetical protein
MRAAALKLFAGGGRDNSSPQILPRRGAETPREKMTFEELAEHEVHCTVVANAACCIPGTFCSIYAARNRNTGIEAF